MAARTPFGQRKEGGPYICSICGRLFSGLRAFDLHRISTTGQAGYEREYDWRCASPQEMTARGLVLDGKVWGQPPPEEPFWPQQRAQEPRS